MMTPRECFKRISNFKKADYIPNYEPGISPRTLAIWRREGLPAGVSVSEFFQLDEWTLVRDISYNPIPGILGRWVSLEQYRPLVEPLGYTVGHDDQGAMVARKQGQDYYIGHSVWGTLSLFAKRTPGDEEELAEGAQEHVHGALLERSEWEALKDQFRPDLAARYPKDWDLRVAKWKTRNHPIVLEAPSMVGALVQMMGFENYAIKLYEDRTMIEEILDKQIELAMVILEKALQDIDFDLLWFWEDMAYRTGPMIGPDIFESLVVPRYKRLTDWYRSKGGQIVSVDSDGDVRLLIPGWIKGGINHIWPLEPFAGMDVVAVRKEYGHAFSMRGGMDKFVVAKGKEAIDRELDRVWPVVEDGGYIPHLDHMLPHASFENYCYYMEKKKKLLGTPSPAIAYA